MLDGRSLEFFIERVPTSELGGKESHLARWKAMRIDGWDLEVLIAPDEKSVVALGCRRRG